jgi:hypothetical protein
MTIGEESGEMVIPRGMLFGWPVKNRTPAGWKKLSLKEVTKLNKMFIKLPNGRMWPAMWYIQKV